LEKNENAERGDKENKVWGFLFPERGINKEINTDTDKTRKERCKKKT
jgi:hypothetical protein